MAAIDIKTELTQLIQKEKDISILEAIKTLLSRSSKSAILANKLESRALKSEKDIKEGKVFSSDEIRTQTNDFLK